jgi:hypothetical protein
MVGGYWQSQDDMLISTLLTIFIRRYWFSYGAVLKALEATQNPKLGFTVLVLIPP